MPMMPFHKQYRGVLIDTALLLSVVNLVLLASALLKYLGLLT